MRRILSVSVLAVFVLSLFPSVTMAAPAVYISEVAWAGSGLSTADEWLEIANAGDAPVDLSNWRIEGAATGNGALVIPAGSVVPAGATFLIANYGADDAHSTLAAQAQWVTTGVALPNDHLHLFLRDATGALVDEAGVGATAAPAGTTGAVKASMERVSSDVVGTDPAAWKTATASSGFDPGASDLGTPGSFVMPIVEPTPPPSAPPLTEEDVTVDAASTPIDDATSTVVTAATVVLAAETTAHENEPSPTAVRLSELMPIPPTGDHEWIELTNPSDVGELLDGWTIEDGRGVIARLSGLLLPWSRVVVELASSHLNDAGDVAILKRASGEVVDAVSYGTWQGVKGAVAKRGESVARVELTDDWSITTHPTLGEANVIEAEPTPAPKTKATKPIAVTKGETASATSTEPTPSAKPVARATSVATRPVSVAVVAAPTAKTAAAPKPTKAKAAAKPRYKGANFEATVAVPLGVYGKTRMMIQVGGALRQLRFTSAPAESPESGTRVSFIAQEKTDGATSYLYANVKTFALSDDDASDEPSFAPSAFWPNGSEPVELSATVVSADAGRLVVSASGTQGVIVMPSTAKLDLKPGDQVSVRGYATTVGEQPLLYLAAPDALTVLAHAIDPNAPSNSRFPPWAAAALTCTVVAIGLLAYLRNERLKRLSLVRREDDLPLEE